MSCRFVPLLNLGVLYACTPVERDGDEGSDVATETLAPLEVTVGERMATVVSVSWPDDAPADAHVSYGISPALDRVAVPDEEGRLLLLGLPRHTEVSLQRVHPGDPDQVGPVQQVTTGGLPFDPVPDLVVEHDDGSGWTEFVLVPFFDTPGEYTDLVVFDAEGRAVWAWRAAGLAERATFARDGSGVRWLTDGHFDAERGGLWTVDWLGQTAVQVIPSVMAHHDYVEHSDGTLAIIESSVQDWNGEPVVGDVVREYAPDGSVAEVWSAFDSYDPVDAGHWDAPSSVDVYGADWTHANGLDYDAEGKRYGVSLYWLNSVAIVDRDSGMLIDTVGGDQSDYVILDDAGFGPQHAPSFTTSGLWVFDNHTEDCASGGGSRLVHYRLDEASHEAEVDWLAEPFDGACFVIGGDIMPLADGGVLATTPQQQAMVLGADGQLRWSAQAPEGPRMSWRGDHAPTLPPLP